MSRGGKRPGSGRKPIDAGERRVHMGARVAPETKRALDGAARRGATSVGRVLDELAREIRPC